MKDKSIPAIAVILLIAVGWLSFGLPYLFYGGMEVDRRNITVLIPNTGGEISPTPTITLTATPSLDPNLSVVLLPLETFTPSATFTITFTPNTTFTTTLTPTVTPTNTRAPFYFFPPLTGGSGSNPILLPTITNTAVKTSTPSHVPPTNTFIPPSNTPIPPTNTFIPPSNTPLPPPDTNTPVPPTNTLVPPSDTPEPPTDTPEPPPDTPEPPPDTPEPPPDTPEPPPDTPEP